MEESVLHVLPQLHKRFNDIFESLVFIDCADGIVEKVNPVLVKEDGFGRACEWDEVEAVRVFEA